MSKEYENVHSVMFMQQVSYSKVCLGFIKEIKEIIAGHFYELRYLGLNQNVVML